MLEYTQTQQVAIKAFSDFINGTADVFMLKGAAGTGKTTLVSEFVCRLKEMNRSFRLMAPTGRAAYIIGKKTECQATTIHKAIYLLSNLSSKKSDNDEDKDEKEEESEDSGAIHAKFNLKRNDDPENTIYIIDESSLISDSFSENEAFSFGSGYLLSDLFEYIEHRKVIFVGDYAQLPPVGMNFSPALDAKYIKDKFDREVTEVMLRTVVRQDAESGILKNANKVRESIEKKTFTDFKLDNTADCHLVNENLLQCYYDLSNVRPDPNSVIITYSNKQALQYNESIRYHYFGPEASRLMNGELLIISRNNYAYKTELFNGNVVRVLSCQSDDEVETHEVNLRVGKGLTETVKLKFREVTIEFRTNSGAEKKEVKILDNFLSDYSGSVGGNLARALMVDFNKRLPDNLKKNLSQIKKVLKSGSNTNEKAVILAKEYINLLNEDKYYNAVICKYGYAITCHKAQGGEWNNVFADMCRFGGTDNEDYFRWVYTAITRASQQLWLYRTPEFNFISKLIVENIQKSSNIKITTYAPENVDFKDYRFSRIKELSASSGISVLEDRTRNYQHWVTFNKGSEHATFNLWYNDKGYSDKIEMREANSEEFASMCRTMIVKSQVPDIVPFSTPERPFAEKLHNYILSMLEEFDIQLLNITFNQYKDIYHLQTDGLAKVEICYNNKGYYIYMRPISSLGEDDTKLELFCQQFI